MGEIKTNWKLSDLKPVSGDVEYYSNYDKKLKPFEVIMRIDPYCLNNGEEICMKGKGVQIIIRCKDCLYRHDSIMCRMYSEGMDTPDNWFCADGKEKEDQVNETDTRNNC